jgi:hypothetical protein
LNLQKAHIALVVRKNARRSARSGIILHMWIAQIQITITSAAIPL